MYVLAAAVTENNSKRLPVYLYKKCQTKKKNKPFHVRISFRILIYSGKEDCSSGRYLLLLETGYACREYQRF